MIRVHVANKAEQATFEPGSGPFELGRGPRREVPRKTIQDPRVSNDQVRVEAIAGDRVRIENLSRNVPLVLANGQKIRPGEDGEFGLPLRFTVGETRIEISPAGGDNADATGTLRTIAPPLTTLHGVGLATIALPDLELAKGPSGEQFGRWLETVVSIQKAAASSPAFYQQTARAVVELIGLDCGWVLLSAGEGPGDDWTVVARYPPEEVPGRLFSRAILERVRQERRTFYQDLSVGLPSKSLADVDAVVAAPILAGPAESERTVGAVYGSRLRRAPAPAAAIQPLEAQLVQVFATAVAAGLARLASETEAARRLVQFEQFFSPDLARALDRDPTLLEGRECILTVLFADIRGFSRIAERLDPGAACQLVGDLMEQVTSRVHDHGGVVVDYYGDGLLALWNAPVEQPEHALLAGRAALAILAELPELDRRWRDRLGVPLGLGVGLNTGTALVGNTGSRSKLKYGPLGHTVNLASRIEGATRHLGVPILISGSTQERLAGALPTRRLCTVRVHGIADAVDLYELAPETAEPQWRAQRDTYEAALKLYESGRWSEACEMLHTLLARPEGRSDLPTLSLLGRTIECLKTPPLKFDPVVELGGK